MALTTSGDGGLVTSGTLGITTVSAVARSVSPYGVVTVAPPTIRSSGCSAHNRTEYHGRAMPAENCSDSSVMPKISAANPDSNPDMPS